MTTSKPLFFRSVSQVLSRIIKNGEVLIRNYCMNPWSEIKIKVFSLTYSVLRIKCDAYFRNISSRIVIFGDSNMWWSSMFYRVVVNLFRPNVRKRLESLVNMAHVTVPRCVKWSRRWKWPSTPNTLAPSVERLVPPVLFSVRP